MPLNWTDIIVPEGVKVPATPEPLNQIGNYLKNQTTDDVPEGSTNEYYTNARSEAVARSIVVNDLETGGTDSPLSAEQGKALSQTIRDRQALAVSQTDVLRKHLKTVDDYNQVSTPNNASGGVEAVLKGNLANSIIQNGDFSDGTDNWVANASTNTVSDNILSNTGSGTANSPNIQQITDNKITINHKYFIRAKIKVSSDCTNIRIYSYNGTSSKVAVSTTPTTFDQFVTYYGITPVQTERGTNNLSIYIWHQYADAATASGKVMQVKEVTVIDMGDSSNPDYDLTADEMNAKYPDYLSYGVHTTGVTRVKSIGKNLFDKDLRIQNHTIDPTNGNLVATTTTDVSNYIGVVENTHYYISGRTSGQNIAYFDFNKQYLSGSYIIKNTVITTPSGAYFLRTGIVKADVDTTQLEKGSTSTPYESYRETTAYSPAVGARLPNDVSDEINILSGEKTQNVQKYVLQASDVAAIVTTGTNIDLVCISNNMLTDAKDRTLWNNITYFGSVFLEKYTEKIYSDSTDNIGTFYLSNNYPIKICVAKSTYADLSAAQSALSGTVIYYQLATPIVTDISIYGDIKIYPNGTVFADPSLWGYTTTATTTVTTSDLPIKSIRKVIRFDVTDGKTVETDVTDDASTSDNLSLTIANFDVTKTYFYDCEYDSRYYLSPEMELNCEVDHGVVSHDYGAAAADWTLTSNESLAEVLTCTNAGAAVKAIIPASDGKQYIIKNSCGYTLTVKTTSSTGITIATGKTATIRYVDSDFIKIGEV